jgi:glycosyltransferase involved in cell wall biosynthesis/GT2 family glycosyltransferase
MRFRVSVIVNTLDRPEGLRRTLRALFALAYPDLEVLVVIGPSSEPTVTVVDEFADAIKVVHCPVANLSVSRNLGIQHASGELVAFIDDDAVPDPWWLDDLVPAFEDSEVAAAGGPIYDYDGRVFSTYALCDSHGDASIENEGTIVSTLFAAPRTDVFVTTIGTNSLFRRTALTEVGGFDEEFDRYMDETDVCRRLVDRGWIVEARATGFVEHMRDPSAVRGADRVLRDLYPLLKSRMYFALRHARPRAGLLEVTRRYEQAVERFRHERRTWFNHGALTLDDVERFEDDAVRAAEDAFESAVGGSKVRPASWFATTTSPFLTLPRSFPDPRLHIAIVSHEYLPKQLNGIGRLSHELALGLAERGHVVRVITEGSTHDSVNLEEGVWVHRVLPQPPTALDSVELPAWVWNFSTQVLRELHRVNNSRPIDIVQIPNWNSEGIAVLEEGDFTTVLGLHTPLKTIARLEPSIDSGSDDVCQLLASEARAYRLATGFLACGPSSLKQIEDEYDVALPRERVGFVPFGIADVQNRDPLSLSRYLNVLFVGRLEARKGADTLLSAIARLLPELPHVAFTLVGRDDIQSGSGHTFREDFELSTASSAREGRVFFPGLVPEDQLGRYYAGCDVFVAPSRHESFGLILLEAMREGKPVIAGDVGGMREIVEHEGNGLLVPTGDVDALADALRRLASSAALRERFGRRSRQLFEERYTRARMAEGYERFCRALREVEPVALSGGSHGQ